jgi:UDP-glucuronate decarboxylase
LIANKTIFLTGGLGFIGSNIIERLYERNTIVVYDNGRRNALTLTDFAASAHIEIISGDILDPVALKAAIDRTNPDIVIHLAAIAGVSSYYKIPKETMEVNIIGTYHVLEAIKDTTIDRYIDFSTSEIYGSHIWRAKEDGTTMQGDFKDQRWTYSISKLAAEKLSHTYHIQYGLPVVSLRPFNIYGPGQVGEGAIQIFFGNALRDEDIVITGDGIQIRAWCYISDMVDAVMLCLENEHSIGGAFNIGNPLGTMTMYELAKKIIAMADSRSRIVFKPHFGVDVDLRVPDIAHARQVLGFEPRVDIEQGLAATAEWYRRFCA